MLKCIGDLNLTGLTVVVDRGVYTVNVPPIVVLKTSCGASHFPINPKLSYQSCHRSAKKALTRQLIFVSLLCPYYTLNGSKDKRIFRKFQELAGYYHNTPTRPDGLLLGGRWEHLVKARPARSAD